MDSKLVKILLAVALIALVWFSVSMIDLALDSTSDTYEQMADEIDQRDIDTGNAMNFNDDETSGNAVYEATQTTEHPPGEPE
ncbi:hypothetical protein GO013_11080 [Pseudodesulfovibrio sp. JC047]|uniref:hypothetical protein n=1 Tax=Pseudodesulfovibrio sp. JC047 TaxID=2683199 RepID=UPI0013CF6777|nr:hypothetical protein [Pseudodesulfovibrio sp. JC047]NDV19964.1 hypothetical protein [Pseudodesulfovibrio sp. JC047]